MTSKVIGFVGFGSGQHYREMEKRKDKIFRYVVHERVHDYLRCGWHIAETNIGHHSFYGVLMQWLCQCKPVEPLRTSHD